VRAPLALALLGLGGCGLFNQPGPDGGTHPMNYGFGKPTLEVTVGGVHFGPATPDSGSAASLVDKRDNATGRVISSSFQATASLSGAGAACRLGLQREGDGVTPIGVASYLLAASSGGPTPDGAVEPIAGEAASSPQGSFACNGTTCNGAGFVLTAVDASHAEGWLSGTFEDVSGGAPVDVACAFWLPMSGYSP
jgi:hypothetical protein